MSKQTNQQFKSQSGNGVRPLKNHSPDESPPGDQRHVLLGVGGTGGETLQETAADERVTNNSNVRMGLIDGDTGTLANRHEAMASYGLTNVPAHELVVEIQKHPENYPGCELLGPADTLREIVPQGTDNMSRGSKKGERRGGKLMFLHHWWRYHQFIIVFILSLVQGLTTMIDRQSFSSNGVGKVLVKGAEKLSIIISMVFSACGGTGSALAVLLVDIMHFVYRHLLGLKRIEFEAHIMLPTVFISRAPDYQSLMSKTYAFFKELAARFEREFPPIQVGPIKLFRFQAPFTWCYLYGSMNANGQQVTSRRELAEVIKHVWYYVNLEPALAGTYRELLEHMNTDYPNNYSAIAIAIDEYPVARIIKQFTYILAQMLLLRLVKEDDNVPDQARQRLEQFYLRYPQFSSLPALRVRTDRQEFLENRQRFAMRLKTIPRSRLGQVVGKLQRDYQSQWPPALAELEQQTAAGMNQILVQEKLALVNQPGGLAEAQHFFAYLDEDLAGQQHRLAKQLDRIKESGGRTKSGGLKVVQRIFKPRQYYVGQAHQGFEQIFDGHRLTAQYELVSQVRERVQDHLQEVKAWKLALVDLLKRLRTAEKEYLRQQQTHKSVVVESVVDKDQDELDRLFNTRINTRLAQAVQGVQFELEADGSLVRVYSDAANHIKGDRWKTASPEGMQHALEYCEQFWQDLWDECSIEAYYQQREVSPAQILADLEYRAAPWCTVNEAQQIPAEQHLLLFGTASGQDYLDEDPGRVHVMPIKDKTRMVFIYAVHGLDVFKLEQYPAWDGAYQQDRAQGKSQHVMPEVDPLSPARVAVAQSPQAGQTEEAEPIPRETAPVPDEQTVAVEKETDHVPITA